MSNFQGIYKVTCKVFMKYYSRYLFIRYYFYFSGCCATWCTYTAGELFNTIYLNCCILKSKGSSSHWAWNEGYKFTARSASYHDLHLEIDSEDRLRTKLYRQKIFPLWTFHSYVATFQQHLHTEHISLSWSDIPDLVVHIMISMIAGCC